MRSESEFSGPTVSVLCALCEEPSQWRHGYALARETRLTPGTLYPVLIRLAARGLVEACWQEEPRAGRPRRQLYRLTADGLTVTVDMLVAVAEAVAARGAATTMEHRCCQGHNDGASLWLRLRAAVRVRGPVAGRTVPGVAGGNGGARDVLRWADGTDVAPPSPGTRPSAETGAR